MKISLIHPPQLNVIDNRQDPPLGLMYIASVLENHGVETSVTDLAGIPEPRWAEHLEEADAYGITCYTATLSHSKKIADLIKSRYPRSRVIVGGAHPSALPEQTIVHGNFDFIVKGEGESAILEVLDRIKAGSTERIVNSRPVMDLDAIPFPARHRVDMYGYSRSVLNRKATNMITGRGCPYMCSFCYKGIYGDNFRLRSAQNVIREAEEIVGTYDIKAIHFLDDIFTIKQQRLRTILDAFRSMDIYFRCNSRVDLYSIEDFEMLYRGGCREIAFGIESGSQSILDRINKRNTVERNKLAIANAKRAGIVTKAYFVVGLPGETPETILETRRFIEETRPDKISIYTFVPYPGTPIWSDPESYGITITDTNFDNYYIIDTNGFGGVTYELSTMSRSAFVKLRNELVHFAKEIYESNTA